jgi:hypothetical protein
MIVVLVLAAASVAHAQSGIRDDFEGPEPSFREAGSDAPYRIDTHVRIPQEAHSGKWCERLTVRGNGGTHIYVSHALAPARVINELTAGVWIKSDRPGIQAALRIALPRSIDPRTGKPLTTLVRGTLYGQPGPWQRLLIGNVPQLLERQVRVMRNELNRDVDSREAYADALVLNVYGGPGVTNIWIDDLEVSGVVPVEPAAAGARTNGPTLPSTEPPQGAPSGPPAPPVELRWPLLLVAGKPFFPRSIDYQGEPLARLQSLGFNTVRVMRPASAELLREAAAARMWVIAPPPAVSELEPRPGESAGVKIGAQFDPVLVWDLGAGLTKSELEASRRWSKLVNAADPRQRPLMCQCETNLIDFTRIAKLLLAGRDTLGSSLPLGDYLTWLRERSQLALPGTPLWATVQTEPVFPLVEQIALLGGGTVPQIALQELQIRTIIHSALAAGARGLCFESHSRLDAPDPLTRRRAAILELLNLELELIERWPASGNFAISATSNDPNAGGAVIETDRSRLLLPIHAPPGGQFVLGHPKIRPLNLTVAGVPEGNDAYELTPTSARPLRSDRVLGGTRVLLGESEQDALVVFTQDALVYNSLKTRIGPTAMRAAQLVREIAAAEMTLFEATEQRLTDVGRALPAARPIRAAAQKDLKDCDAQLAKKDARAAYDLARRALGALTDVEREYWERVPPTPWPSGEVWLANFATLPEHYRFAAEMISAPRGGNLLAEGGFEDLDAMRRAGWAHNQHPPEAVTANVELSAEAAHSGRTGLRLTAALKDPKAKPGAVETPPLWITSPAVNAQPGQLLEIQGWARVSQPLAGSVDGLMVIDTLTGQALAQRITANPQWRQFTIYRVAPRPGPVSLTFALSGLGEACIDDITIQVVQRANATGAPPMPPTQQAGIPARPPGK